MQTRIVKQFTFDAAHHLPNHDGKCRRPHGHTYKVELAFIGQPQSHGAKEGMVIDFADVSAWFKRFMEMTLDHHDLNEMLPETHHPTTAENIARYIYDEAHDVSLHAEWVRVWETPTAYAEYPAVRIPISSQDPRVTDALAEA